MRAHKRLFLFNHYTAYIFRLNRKRILFTVFTSDLCYDKKCAVLSNFALLERVLHPAVLGFDNPEVGVAGDGAADIFVGFFFFEN